MLEGLAPTTHTSLLQAANGDRLQWSGGFGLIALKTVTRCCPYIGSSDGCSGRLAVAGLADRLALLLEVAEKLPLW
jgi:hypothetical protein